MYECFKNNNKNGRLKLGGVGFSANAITSIARVVLLICFRPLAETGIYIDCCQTNRENAHCTAIYTLFSIAVGWLFSHGHARLGYCSSSSDPSANPKNVQARNIQSKSKVKKKSGRSTNGAQHANTLTHTHTKLLHTMYYITCQFFFFLHTFNLFSLFFFEFCYKGIRFYTNDNIS